MIEEGQYPPMPSFDEISDDEAEGINRINRDYLLEQSDWTQLSDINQQTRYAYVGYRQALRDLPDHPNWPQLNAEDWPKKPNV
jgi:hypothetical protein